jgi:hypothetical protein
VTLQAVSFHITATIFSSSTSREPTTASNQAKFLVGNGCTSVLQKTISSNHAKFGGKETNGSRVLEVGRNEASILMIRYRQLKTSLGTLLTTSSGKDLSWTDGSFAVEVV